MNIPSSLAIVYILSNVQGNIVLKNKFKTVLDTSSLIFSQEMEVISTKTMLTFRYP